MGPGALKGGCGRQSPYSLRRDTIMIQFSARPSRGAVITTLSVTLLTSGFLFQAAAGARDFGGGGLRGMGGGGLDRGGYHFGGDDMGGYRGSHPMFGDGARPQGVAIKSIRTMSPLMTSTISMPITISTTDPITAGTPIGPMVAIGSIVPGMRVGIAGHRPVGAGGVAARPPGGWRAWRRGLPSLNW